jgi:hypothetical protein
MRRARPTTSIGRPCAPQQLTIPLDDGTAMLAMIQELIPLGLKAVGEALVQEVAALAGPAMPAVMRIQAWCDGGSSPARSTSPIRNSDPRAARP